MPRGIPNKPKEPVEADAVKHQDSDEARMYSLYVHGTPISHIALKFKVEAQEVLEAIQAIEEKR